MLNPKPIRQVGADLHGVALAAPPALYGAQPHLFVPRQQDAQTQNNVFRLVVVLDPVQGHLHPLQAFSCSCMVQREYASLRWGGRGVLQPCIKLWQGLQCRCCLA